MSNATPTGITGSAISLRAATRRWLASGALVIALHGSVAAWALHRADMEMPEDDVSGSAMPIEMAAFAASVPGDVAPKIGDPTPQVAEQAARDAREDTRRPPDDMPAPIPDVPAANADDAVRQVVERERDDPKEDKPEAPPQPATVAIAPQDAAAMPSAAPAAERSTSLSQGITPSMRKSKASWQKALLTHIDKSKRYPDAARAAHAEGEVMIEFSIDRTGSILAKRLLRSSGSSLLDAEAIAMLARAEPLPPPPTDVVGESFTLAVPVRFRLR